MYELFEYFYSKFYFWKVIFPWQLFLAIIFWVILLYIISSKERKNFFLQSLVLSPYKNSGEFYYYLDALKGFAAIIVVGLHVYSFNAPFYQAAPINFSPFGQGQKGVAIFLVVSGFLVSKYFSERESISSQDVKEFFIRRAIRLYPLYIAVTLYMYLNNIPLLTTQSHKFFAELFMWSEFNFLQNGVAWSMIVEMKMYLITPIFFMVFGPKRYSRIIFAIALIICLSLSEPMGGNELGSPISPWYKYFIFGILGNDISHYFKNIKQFWYYLFFLIGMLIMSCDFSGYYFFFEKFPIGKMPSEYRTFLSNQMGVAIMLICIFGGKVSLFKLLTNNTILVWVGMISYSLYLTQFIFLGKSLYNPGIQEEYALTFYFVLIPYHIITATLIFLVFEKFPRYIFQKYSGSTP